MRVRLYVSVCVCKRLSEGERVEVSVNVFMLSGLEFLSLGSGAADR